MRGRFKMKTAAKILLLVAVIVGSFYVAVTKYYSTKILLEGKRYNVLALSFCSLREDVLGLYSKRGKDLTPNIEKFFSPGAFLFENAINPNPWTSLFHFLRNVDLRRGANTFGYEVVAFDRKGYTRIPVHYGRAGEEKGYSEALGEFRAEVLKKRRAPFAAVAHITYMHYPYIDRTNKDSGWDRFLSAKEKARLDSYFADPKKYAGKLPFLLVLTGDVNLVRENPRTAHALHGEEGEDSRLLGLVSNRELLRDWKASAGFKEDVVILRKIYDANARYLDQFIADALNLWGDEELRENTVVVFTGDHGEMNMDHDELTHATALYDRAVRFPLMIRAPGQSGGIERRKEQIQLESVALMLKDLMTGALRAPRMADFWHGEKKDVLILRDCANTLRGLRFDNKWKYIVRLADGQASLFDLEKDPEEKINLAAKMPAKAAEMEQLYWANYTHYVHIPTRNCAPTEGAK